MNYFCKIFEQNSLEVKNWIINQPNVGEESITDWFLYNISKSIRRVTYKKFSRFEESRTTGADWEWWFIFSDTEAFGCRVQAKRLRSNKDNYPGIAYVSNGKLQIERLLENSDQDSIASFYAFYTKEQSNQMLCSNKYSNGGVYFGEANSIYNNFILKPKQKLKPRDIITQTYPISCLMCCPITMVNGRIDISGFKENIKRYFPLFNQNSGQRNVGFKEPPRYIQLLISGELNESMEKQYERTFSKMKSIIAIDLRNYE